jgi:hypothetical protein
VNPAQSNGSLTQEKYAIATHLFVAPAFQYISAPQQVEAEVLKYSESDPIPLAWVGYDWLARSLAVSNTGSNIKHHTDMKPNVWISPFMC